MYGKFCDILWSDPSSENTGWSMSSRGVSFCFDDNVLEKFCEDKKIDLIVRGHQLPLSVISY